VSIHYSKQSRSDYFKANLTVCYVEDQWTRRWEKPIEVTTIQFSNSDRLCGLVARVLGYRSGGSGSIPGTIRKKVVNLERGPLTLVSTTEELLDRKLAAPV
jgi:hypothetical protein